MRTKNEVDTRRVPRVETRRDRKALARDAGMGQMSFVSILAGTLAAYGAVAVLLAIAGGIAAAVNSGTNFNNVAWTQLKAGTGVIVAVVLLLGYLFGGYVAGRMARRSGLLNGIGVFVLGVIIALAVGVLAKYAGAGTSLTNALRNVGAPTTWHEWRDVGTVAGIAALVAMLLGSMLGGSMGDRWHSKLLNRALDPTVGPEATRARESTDRAAAADTAHLDAEQRVARSQGRVVPAGAAMAEPAVADRRERREERLADERTGMVEPVGPVATSRRDERLAAEEGAVPETRQQRVADERETAREERGNGVAETRQQRVADERLGTDEGAVPETRQQRIADDQQLADGRSVNGADGATTVDDPQVHRSLKDRLLRR